MLRLLGQLEQAGPSLLTSAQLEQAGPTHLTRAYTRASRPHLPHAKATWTTRASRPLSPHPSPARTSRPHPSHPGYTWTTRASSPTQFTLAYTWIETPPTSSQPHLAVEGRRGNNIRVGTRFSGRGIHFAGVGKFQGILSLSI